MGVDSAVCGQPGVPTLYTRVTHFLDWINENRNTFNNVTQKPSITETETNKLSGIKEEKKSFEFRKITYPYWLPITYRINYGSVPYALPWRSYTSFPKYFTNQGVHYFSTIN